MKARIRRIRHRDLDGISRNRLTHLQNAFAINDVIGNLDSYEFTADNTTDELNITGSNIATDNPKCFTSSSASVPEGIEAGEVYFLGEVNTELYKLYRNKEDAVSNTDAVSLTDDGTGTLTLTIL